MSYFGFKFYLLNWNFQLPCIQGPKVLAEAIWSGTVITPSCISVEKTAQPVKGA